MTRSLRFFKLQKCQFYFELYSQELVRRKIESTDRMIDNLVYELPKGLTEEEIKIVEGINDAFHIILLLCPDSGKFDNTIGI